MQQRIVILVLGFVLMASGWGCGGGEKNSGGGAETAMNETPAAAVESGSEAPEIEVVQTDTATTPAAPRYKTVHDPKAIYGADDLPNLGSYLKVDFTGLTADQLNRVIHRMRTEYCTCGCTDDTIDQCLVNDPACGVAVTLANQVIREEKVKG